MSIKTVNACSLCGGYCWSCGYTDNCKQWADIAPYTPATIEVPCVKLALCESRHEIPEVDGAVFPNTVDPTDMVSLRVHCARRLKSEILDKGITYLDLYVTGLTVALVEVINWCIAHKVHLTLWHYDRESGDYYPQEVRV